MRACMEVLVVCASVCMCVGPCVCAWAGCMCLGPCMCVRVKRAYAEQQKRSEQFWHQTTIA